MLTNKSYAVAAVLALLIALSWAPAALAEESGCIQCHTNAETLKMYTKTWPAREVPGGRGGHMAPSKLERYEKVLVDEAFLEDPNHGDIGCEVCHGGDPENTDYDKAHQGVDLEPSFPAPGVCADCHDDVAENYATSLHYTVRGLRQGLDRRADSDPDKRRELFGAFGNCARCHSTCGQCHVGRPIQVGGGLKNGHMFSAELDMDETCARCHGSGVAEFQGKADEAILPDLHFSEAEFTCMDCHSKEELHGDGNTYSDRYHMESSPSCLDCHEEIYDDDAENKKTHTMHKDRVSCQVCHSQAYTNCTSCHLDTPWTEDKYTSRMDFKIGYNPNPDEKHPEKFVLLRQTPITRDMFEKVAPGALSNFDQAPTWAMATPHNIQRQTPQNQDCNNCHGVKNKDKFLLLWDVDESVRAANRPVIVPPAKIPAPIAPEE